MSGLDMPVARIQRHLREGHYAERIGTASAVYLSAVLEYVTAELLELAGNAAHQNKKRRIHPRHILLAIENDEELKALLRDVQIPGGGVFPHIHPVLLKTKSSKKGGDNGDVVEVTVPSQEI